LKLLWYADTGCIVEQYLMLLQYVYYKLRGRIQNQHVAQQIPSQENVGDVFDPESIPQQSEVVRTRLLIGLVAYAMFRKLIWNVLNSFWSDKRQDGRAGIGNFEYAFRSTLESNRLYQESVVKTSNLCGSA
jgi:hypothetical protein